MMSQPAPRTTLLSPTGWTAVAIALLVVTLVVPVLNGWMALDFGANAAMLGLSLWGWRKAGGESRLGVPHVISGSASRRRHPRPQ